MILILGYLAGIFGVIPMIPQIYKSCKTKSTNDLSVLFIILNIISSVLWTTYGFLIHDMPIFICSLFFGILHLILFCMKIYYDYYYSVEVHI